MEDRSSETKSIEAAAASDETNPAEPNQLRQEREGEYEEEIAAAAAEEEVEEARPEVTAATTKTKRLAVRPTSLFSNPSTEQQINMAKKMTEQAYSLQLEENAHNMNNFKSQNVQNIKHQVSSASATNSAQTVCKSMSSNTAESSSLVTIPANRLQQHQLQQQNNHHQQQQQTRTGAGSAGDLSQQIDPQNPYPLYAPITFFYLNQTARPRSWCLAIVSNKYPSQFNHHQ